MSHANEVHDLRCTSHNAPNSPVNRGGNVGGCDNQLRGVSGNVLRREVRELDNALGHIEHGLDEVVQGFELGFQGIGVLQNVRQLLEERQGLGRGGWMGRAGQQARIRRS